MKKSHALPISLAVLLLGLLASALYFSSQSVSEKSTSTAAATKKSQAVAVPKNQDTPAASAASAASRVSDPLPADAPDPSTSTTPDLNARIGYAQKPLAPGDSTVAKVQVDGRDLELTPNQIGNFQRVYVQPLAEIPVKMVFEKGEAGEVAVVRVEDGGQLDNKTLAKVVKLDANRTISFQYRVTDQAGSFRVVVRKGATARQLDFWVGPPLLIAPITPLELAAQH